MTGTTKSSATSMGSTSKNSATMNGMIRAGQGWKYDEAGITYDGEFDADGRRVLYDGIGTAPTMIPLTKNAA